VRAGEEVLVSDLNRPIARLLPVEIGDEIEAEGKRRAIQRAEAAEIRLFVFDAGHPAEAAGAAAWPGPDTILVANKIDLLPPRAHSPRGRENSVMPGLGPGIHGAITDVTDGDDGVDAYGTSPWAEGPRDTPGHDDERLTLPQETIPVSALTGEGVGRLLAVLGERVARNYRIEAPLLTRARHRQALEETVSALRRSLAALLPELRVEDLRLALRSLGRITGAVDVEDLLDVIFRDFCIGK